MKLSLRLAAYFFLVIAVATGTTFFFVNRTTESLFRSYIYSGDAQKAEIYSSILGEYYDEHHDWTGVQTFLSELPQLAFLGLDESIHGISGETLPPGSVAAAVNALLSDRIAVADIHGVIVADTAGRLLRTIHPAGHLANGVPIVVNDRKAGTVLVGSMVDSSLSGMSERFLVSITKALFWAVSLSTVLALLLGLVLSAQVTKPIVMLTGAARRVAAGDLSAVAETAKGKVGKDEISDLSESFNVMTGELKRLEDAKKQIIADSAHELRTPVTLIQGTVEAMIDGVYPLDIPTLESVHEETVRLAHLIDMLRELEIIESGKLALQREPLDCGEFLRGTAALFAAQAKEKNIALIVDVQEPSPELVADRLRIGEVIYNLVSNAIKYTPAGGTVRLRAGVKTGVSVGQPAGSVQISVDDSGPGIPVRERERIFERFYRLDGSRSTDRGGRGLGLAIASEITKAHGGSLVAKESDLGGASFVLTLART